MVSSLTDTNLLQNQEVFTCAPRRRGIRQLAACLLVKLGTKFGGMLLSVRVKALATKQNANQGQRDQARLV
jgi:hypothetical protein